MSQKSISPKVARYFIWSILFLCSSLSCFAEYIPPELIKVSTTKYDSQKVIYNPGRYTYSISWQGIPVASAEVILGEAPQLLRSDFKPTPDDLTIRVTAKTAKVIDLLYRLRHSSESTFNVAALKPIAFTSDQTENSKYKRWEVLFSPENIITSKLWKEPKEELLNSKNSIATKYPEPNETSVFHSDNFTLDPLFGAILARSLPVHEGSEVEFDIWNGKHRYLIKFKVDGQEYVEVGKQKILADRIIPTVKRLSDTEGEKRIKSCTMWVSADERRDILKLDSKVFLGSISAVLKNIEPLPDTPALTPVIQAAISTSKDARAMLDSHQ